MKYTAEKLDKNKAQVTVEVSVEDFEKSLEKAYRIVVKKVNIPGFRKGKAPRRMVEKLFGWEVLLEDALEDAVPRAYYEALEEIKEEYTAVSDPQFDMVQTEQGKPLIFKAAFDSKPEVVLGPYKGLELVKPEVKVGAEAVDQEIEKMQQRYAKLLVVEGPAQMGDSLTIDFLGKIDGTPFAGGTGENYPLELGSHSFIEGFEEQLVGAKLEEVRDLPVTFPEAYHSQELAGKEAVFTVTVKEIKRKEMAPLDDEFAKDVSEFATMQELRQDIENKLKEAAQKNSENELESEAIKKASDNAEVDIPQSMIEKRVDRMIEEFAYRLSQQGLSFEYYLKMTDMTIERMRETYQVGAKISIKSDLVLEAIAKAEGIRALEEEVALEIEKMAEQYKQEPEKVRLALKAQGQLSALEMGIMMEKVVKYIIAEAKMA